MIVKYWFRTDTAGTVGPFQCDKDEIKQMLRHWNDFFWLKVQLPNGDTWFKADYIANGRWRKIR